MEEKIQKSEALAKLMNKFFEECCYYDVSEFGTLDALTPTIKLKIKSELAPIDIFEWFANHSAERNIYGYVIQWNISSMRYTINGIKEFVGGEHYSRHWKHKIYADRDAAIKAINQSHHNTNESYVKIKYRIAPVYVLDEFENLNL